MRGVPPSGPESLAMTLGERAFRIVIGSDLVRDGMYVEVTTGPRVGDVILEVFHSDVHHAMVVSLFAENVPVEVVEWAISVARERLPAMPDDRD
jgi:hypothetical protein